MRMRFSSLAHSRSFKCTLRLALLTHVVVLAPHGGPQVVTKMAHSDVKWIVKAQKYDPGLGSVGKDKSVRERGWEISISLLKVCVLASYSVSERAMLSARALGNLKLTR